MTAIERRTRDQGSEFAVKLPALASGGQATTTTTWSPGSRRAGRLRVLVVEDNVDSGGQPEHAAAAVRA